MLLLYIRFQTYSRSYEIFHNCWVVSFRYKILKHTEFKISMKCSILWYVTPCNPLNVSRRFGGIYLLYLQGRRMSKARMQGEKGWKYMYVWSNARYPHKDYNTVVFSLKPQWCFYVPHFLIHIRSLSIFSAECISVFRKILGLMNDYFPKRRAPARLCVLSVRKELIL
jgi:hypothetical protein